MNRLPTEPCARLTPSTLRLCSATKERFEEVLGRLNETEDLLKRFSSLFQCFATDRQSIAWLRGFGIPKLRLKCFSLGTECRTRRDLGGAGPFFFISSRARPKTSSITFASASELKGG